LKPLPANSPCHGQLRQRFAQDGVLGVQDGDGGGRGVESVLQVASAGIALRQRLARFGELGAVAALAGG
jgi:hypothetical protein